MSSGKEKYLTRQCGEYLVAAELSRRGWITTTFTGNMPGFDIIAVNKDGILRYIQVKASGSDSFVISLEKYVDIEMKENSQIIKSKKPLQSPDVLNILVKVAGKTQEQKDEYYILIEKELQDLSERVYREFLNKYGGIRPRKPESLVHRIFLKDLQEYKSRWDKLEE